MKRLTFIPVLLFIFASINLLAQSYNYTYTFKTPKLIKTQDGYTEIIFDQCYNFGEEGKPLIPVFGANLLVAQTQIIKEVKILSAIYTEFTDGVKIIPASGYYPISKGIPKNYEVIPEEAIYNSSDPYPSKTIDHINTHFICGHSIGSFSIYPVVYIPSENKVKFLTEITIRVESIQSERAIKSQSFLRNNLFVKNRIQKITDNPELISGYQYGNNRDYPEYDILLITNNALMPYYEDYINFKISTGYLVKTITTETIYSTFSGQDNQEMIRNCIIDSYNNDGISAVILGGDSDPSNPAEDVIPHRGLFVNLYNEDDIPADMYYACLDGNWNSDGDNYWGEPGEEDLYGEVIIGRICADNATEIQNMTDKLYMYQNEPVVADIEKALMIGEALDGITWGGDSKDEVADGSSSYGYTTVGISGNFTVTELYERDMSWNKYDVFSQFNNVGVNLLNHLGHSSVTYNMKMSNSDITTTNFTNDGITRGYAIGYSQGCYNGSFDSRNSSGYYISSDCFAEKITTIETAEVATVGNSRYGWYSPGTTGGPSQYLDRQFYDAIFGEDLTLIGEANGDSKEDNASFIAGSPYIRWCVYELNVFGDPTMDIWTAVPTAISATYPISIIIGSSQISFETDAPYARICVMQNDSVLGRDLADSNGDLTLNLFDPINSADTLNVSIIAHDRIRHLGDIIVITNQPFIVYEACLIDDSLGGNNNGQIDYGETIDLTVWMTNIGNLDASNVNVILSSEDPFVIITDSIENYGAILAGQSICVTDGFQFEVSSDIPDQHSILFKLEAIETETWISYFTIDANAPELTIGDLIVVDSVTGNGNGMMDPGETVEIYIESSNTGHSLVTDIDGTISSYNSLLTIINSTYTIDTLVPGETQYAIYQISINPIAHIGMIFDLDNEIISGAYSDEKTFYIKVGVICEDWETGDFTQFNWFYGGDADWSLTTTNTFEGIFSALSGTIGDNQSSELIITLQVLADDSISFYRKVSSEPNYDHLNFYIDDEKIDEWSGDVSYERVAFPVTYGIHTFKWAYEKDEATSVGLDCAWLDYINLPYTIVPTANAGQDTAICAGDTCLLYGSATNFTEIMWTTSGTGSFNDSSLMDPVYYPSEDDIIIGEVVLTLHAMHNLGANICDDMILTINDVPATPETPEGPTYIDLFTTISSEYTIPVVTNTDSYLWVLYPEDAGTIEGTDTTGTVTWNGLFLGYAYIKVKGMNDCGIGEFSDSLEVFVDNTVGVDEKSSGTVTFEIIPNPATDQTNILLYLNEDAITTLKIYSSQGELINNIVSNVMLQKGKHKFMINLSSLRKGVYYCVLITNNNLLGKKMVIIR